jgi:hypothetical protein
MHSDDTRELCTCGSQLQHFEVTGVWPHSGWLCPKCDHEHAAELAELERAAARAELVARCSKLSSSSNPVRQVANLGCRYERTLHAAIAQEGLPLELAATVSLVALRFGPHGRLRATHFLAHGG